jgi:sigma-B regulation protein RsbU (phosphoserine phosphatase)
MDTDWHERDLARARQLQRRFLPHLRSRPGLKVVAGYRPAFQVGGDFYDLVHLPDGRVTALIGDVSGKGVSAALLMAPVSTELRRLAGERLGPRRILVEAERWFAGQRFGERFVTAACVQLQPAHRRWMVANAAHVVPLLRRKDGTVLRLAEPSGCPLGTGLPGPGRYREEEFPAHPGDTLVLVTDGLVGALDAQDEDLRRMVAGCRGDVDGLRRALWRRLPLDHAPRDDATLLALQLEDSSA